MLEGLLGADVIGFQRVADAGNFARAVRRQLRYETKASGITRAARGTARPAGASRAAFPISIDAASYIELARSARGARACRRDPREPRQSRSILLGVDRLDYTKGIRHRLKAYGELLEEGRVSVEDVTLVQVASPSRERVAAYMQLRDEIELMVGRINGDHDTMGHAAIRYLHQAYPARRDGRAVPRGRRHARHGAARRHEPRRQGVRRVRVDNRGVLVLSEFAGAADELGGGCRVNPHDIDGLKDAIMRAVQMPAAERAARMRAAAPTRARARRRGLVAGLPAGAGAFHRREERVTGHRRGLDTSCTMRCARVAASDRLLVALDFDGTLAPLEDEPMRLGRCLPPRRGRSALAALPDTSVAYVSGRQPPDLAIIAEHPDDSRVLLAGSHGAEYCMPAEGTTHSCR